MVKFDPMRTIEFVTVILSVSFGAYFYMDNIHASKNESRIADYELETQIIQSDLNRDTLARRTYEEQQELSPADQRRYDYIVQEIERKQEKISKIQDRIDQLQDD